MWDAAVSGDGLLSAVAIGLLGDLLVAERVGLEDGDVVFAHGVEFLQKLIRAPLDRVHLLCANAAFELQLILLGLVALLHALYKVWLLTSD